MTPPSTNVALPAAAPREATSVEQSAPRKSTRRAPRAQQRQTRVEVHELADGRRVAATRRYRDHQASERYAQYDRRRPPLQIFYAPPRPAPVFPFAIFGRF
jgi:hypothetical protein